MGLHDAEEMLEVAKEQAILDERTIEDLTRQRSDLVRRLGALRRLLAAETISLQDSEDASYEVVEVWRVLQILDEPDAEPAPTEPEEDPTA